MRVVIGVLLWATLGGFVATAAASAPAAGTPATHNLYARLHAVARELDHAGDLQRAPAASIDARIAALRKEVGALTSAPSVAGRDRAALRVMLNNIEHKRAQPATPPRIVPAHRDAAHRATFADLDARHGARCPSAYALAADGEIDGLLPAGATLWLRIDARHVNRVALDTAAAPLAASIDLFDACPASESAAAKASAAGLGARIVADTSRTRTIWARVRNLGDGGNVAIIATPEDGTIEGHVADATSGDGLGSAVVIAFDPTGFAYITNAFFDGDYSLAVTDGSYVVLAGAEHYVAEAWPGQPCVSIYDPTSCVGAPPQRIDVAGTVTGIDFALGHGASITGRVREAETNVAIDDGFVHVFDADGYERAAALLDAAGRYRADGLIAGTYRATASSFTHGEQAYDGIPCFGGCDITNATPIALADDATVPDIDFTLPRAFYIEANVHTAGTVATDITVDVYDSTGEIVTNRAAVVSDTPTPVGPLRAGTYYVGAYASNFREQLFDHVDCTLYCFPPFPGITPVVVSSATPAPQLGFDLQPLASVSGVVTDAATQAPLEGAVVTLWADTDPSYQLGGTLTDFDGTYRVVGLPAGSAWVVVTSWDHRDTAYPAAPCDDFRYGTLEACDLASATPIAIDNGATVTGIDVALPKNGSLRGTVRTRGTGDFAPPLANGWVRLFATDGTPLSVTNTMDDGTYLLSDLPQGSYFARADANDYFSQTWPSHDCPTRDGECPPTTGSPIAIAAGANVEGIDFDPVGAFAIVGRVTDAATGAGIAGAGLDQWLADTDQHCSAVASDSEGYYLLAADADPACYEGGPVKVSTDAGAPFIDQLFDGVACPDGPAFLGLCPLAGATPIAVPTVSPTPIVVGFTLGRVDPIFASGFD